MTTIGDVLMVFGAIALLSFSLLAALVLLTILLPVHSAKMANRIETLPGRTLLAGASITLPALIVIVVMANLPNPATKLLALFSLFVLLACAALGAAGIVRLASDRIKNTANDVTHYGSVTRAAGLVVGAANIPLVGWFVFAPLFIFASVGLFVNGFLTRRNPATPWDAANG